MHEAAIHGVVGTTTDLDLLFAAVSAVRELADDATADTGRRYDLSIRWGVLLAGRLPRLAHYHAEGALAPAERARYASLREELRQVLPLVDRLGLTRPRVLLEEDGR